MENPAWKTHNTKDYHSKEFYKKKMASTSKDEPPFEKCKTYSRTSLAIKKFIKKEIKTCLARRDAGYISSSDSDSDWLASTTEDGDIRDEVNCKNNRSINQNKHNGSDVFASFTQ